MMTINIVGNDVTSPLTKGSQHYPYGHQGCYLVGKIVSNILKKHIDKRNACVLHTSKVL